MANILDKLPQRERARRGEEDCVPSTWPLPRAEAERFGPQFGGVSGNARTRNECLSRDLEACLQFDFPKEHWKHSRTTNPIESVSNQGFRTDAANDHGRQCPGLHLDLPAPEAVCEDVAADHCAGATVHYPATERSTPVAGQQLEAAA